jgi:hypothetical protein
MKTTRGIFAGLDEESFNKIKKTFNVEEAKVEPKKKTNQEKKHYGKNKRRNSKRNKDDNRK